MSKDAKYIESCLEKLSKGEYRFEQDDKILNKNNSAGRMARLVHQIAQREKDKQDELKMVADGDFSLTQENIKIKDDSVKKIIDTLKNIKSELNETVENEDNGKEIDENRFHGGFLQLAGAVNEYLKTALSPAAEIRGALNAMAKDDFSCRVSGTGLFQDMAGDINALSARLENIENTVSKLSNGDFENIAETQKCGEDDKLTAYILKLKNTLLSLEAQTDGISKSLTDGDFKSAKFDEESFDGGYRTLVENINKALSSLTAPVAECADAAAAIAENNFDVACNTELKGDFARLANAMNTAREHFIAVRSIAEDISQGNIDGLQNISAETLCEEDTLTPALAGMSENIFNLIESTSEMAEATENGDLLYRIDTDKVKGKFRDMLEGFNGAFDMMTNPIIEMSSVLEGLSTGNTKDLVTGTYTGVFDALKNDVNAIITQNQRLLQVITETLTQVANGNLDINKIKEFEGDWNGVPIALNNIIDALNNLVGNIFEAIDEVTAGANQVATGSQELSQGATEQASSIEELTASIAEVASQTKLNAQNAGKASTLAKSMRGDALSSNNEMKDMLTSMQEINESSKNISKIIKVIDDIAFQTNILALNAAVEAARAGQNGKGFAVVADEVRNLAAKSANAAKDTTALIEGSIKRVEKGTEIATDTAKMLGGIVNGVEKVATLVENIATASNEQATAITQINQGLEQVSKVVQTNSATAEQSAAASEELSGQAGLLKGNVERIKLRKSTSSHYSGEMSAAPEAAVVNVRKTEPNKPSKINIDMESDFGKY